MMAVLQLARFSVTLSLQLPEVAFKEVFPSSVNVLGEKIAEQVIVYEQQQELGYYPALQYFRDNPGIVDDYLLTAVDQVADVAMKLAAHKTYQMLQPVFSQVIILTEQNLVYGLPHVRPRHEAHDILLAKQYTPNQVKLTMEVSLFQKSKPQPELASGVKKIVLRWLSDVFDNVEVNDSRLL